MESEGLKITMHAIIYLIAAILVIIVIAALVFLSPKIKTALCLSFAKYWWFKLLPISCV